MKVFSIKQLWQTDEFGSTMEVTLDLEGTGLKYNSAGNLLIFPSNSNLEVSKFIRFCEESINITSKFAFKVKEG